MLIRSGESPILSEIVGANRARIGKHIENFHNQAGTAGPNIDRCITALKSPSAEILVSIHQPNLFAFAGVFKKIILLQCLKSIAEHRNSTRKFQICFSLSIMISWMIFGYDMLSYQAYVILMVYLD